MVKNEIKVFARLKPERSRKRVVNYRIHRRPKKHQKEDFLVLTAPQKLFNDYINNRPNSWNFSFYKIFDESTEQDEIFDNVARPVVHSVLNGYNGTIFAYGQTGSGKTYSITGDQKRYEERGVLPRTVQYLFDVIRKNPENLYSVEISYLEIYNENGYDLLDPRHNVATRLEDLPRVTIQEDEAGSLHLKNLSSRSVRDEKDAMDLLFVGETNRAISETPMNPQSSRSHCIFTILVSVKQFGADRYSRAKMHLVDLAGSERVYKCAITGTTLTEAKHINLSLHYLEQVIVCLGQENTTHIPYRNSLLTAILRDSLGGNCLTTMLATLSVATSNLEETISTCRFSQRVALIKNDVNLIFEKSAENENMFLKMENERLKQQIDLLTRQYPTGELGETEKRDLNFQIDAFLKSESNIICDNDLRKTRYCFEILRERLKTGTGESTCLQTCSKNLEYYKNLIVQRDKEISLLIDLLKKERANNVKENLNTREKNKDDGEMNCAEYAIKRNDRSEDIVKQAQTITDSAKNDKFAIAKYRFKLNESYERFKDHWNQSLEGESNYQSQITEENISTLKSWTNEASNVKVPFIQEKLTKNVEKAKELGIFPKENENEKLTGKKSESLKDIKSNKNKTSDYQCATSVNYDRQESSRENLSSLQTKLQVNYNYSTNMDQYYETRDTAILVRESPKSQEKRESYDFLIPSKNVVPPIPTISICELFVSAKKQENLDPKSPVFDFNQERIEDRTNFLKESNDNRKITKKESAPDNIIKKELNSKRKTKSEHQFQKRNRLHCEASISSHETSDLNCHKMILNDLKNYKNPEAETTQVTDEELPRCRSNLKLLLDKTLTSSHKNVHLDSFQLTSGQEAEDNKEKQKTVDQNLKEESWKNASTDQSKRDIDNVNVLFKRNNAVSDSCKKITYRTKDDCEHNVSEMSIRRKRIKSPEKTSTTSKFSALSFPHNVVKMIGMGHRQGKSEKGSPESPERIKSGVKSESQKGNFKTSTLLRSMLCLETNSKSCEDNSPRNGKLLNVTKNENKTTAELIEKSRNDSNLETSADALQRKIFHENNSERRTSKIVKFSTKESDEKPVEIEEKRDSGNLLKNYNDELLQREEIKKNVESNCIEKNDTVLDKSLPLTGDPEIDEEIIAFYRAKRSGGTY